MDKPHALRALLGHGEIVVAPGAFDGLSARLVERAGFSAVYGSGGAIARSSGYPDLGILSLTEVLDRMQRIVESTDLPVIADADTGFGNTINMHRVAKEYSRIGVAAFHIEDQTFPKRCGHLDDKSLVSVDEMVLKIKTAKDVVGSSGPLVIARTDAIAVEGFSQALERGARYGQAGADMLFIEAPESEEQIEAIGRELAYPKLINMFYGGKTPLVARDDLQRLGFQLIIIPSDLQRAAIRSMQVVLDAIHQHGDSSSVAQQLASFEEREEIIGTSAYLEIDQRHRQDVV